MVHTLKSQRKFIDSYTIIPPLYIDDYDDYMIGILSSIIISGAKSIEITIDNKLENNETIIIHDMFPYIYPIVPLDYDAYGVLKNTIVMHTIFEYNKGLYLNVTHKSLIRGPRLPMQLRDLRIPSKQEIDEWCNSVYNCGNEFIEYVFCKLVLGYTISTGNV